MHETGCNICSHSTYFWNPLLKDIIRFLNIDFSTGSNISSAFVGVRSALIKSANVVFHRIRALPLSEKSSKNLVSQLLIMCQVDAMVIDPA